MSTPVKALTVCTTASLASVIAATIAAGSQLWLWAAWAVLAAVTAVVVTVDTRQHA